MKKAAGPSILCAVMLLAVAVIADAQQPQKVARIGILQRSTPSLVTPHLEVFFQALRELGYVEGKNILIEYRFAEENLDRLSELAAELVHLKVDIIVVSGGRPTAAAKHATSTIPIVVAGAGDLVGAGLVASLAKPGGNITGSTGSAVDASAKRLELLRELTPKATRVAVVWHPNPGDRPGGMTTDWDEVKETETAARQLGVKVQPVEVRDPKEFESAYAVMTKQQAKAVILIRGAFTGVHHKRLVELALKHRLPSMCEPAEWARNGCLMSYGPEEFYGWRLAATYVDKILKGRKPADLPVERPKKFELVINAKTAKQIGVTIPQSMLYRADKVIK
jgi:ABC-type uncharacterized transport system substrate-binding protein